jgi:hypothetical protein
MTAFQTITRVLAALLLLIQTPVHAEGFAHDGGLWGSIKEPIRDSVKEKYDGLDDKGKFCVGMGVGFCGTKMIIRSECVVSSVAICLDGRFHATCSLGRSHHVLCGTQLFLFCKLTR